MENLFEKNYALEIGEQSVTAIQQKIDIYQDGTTPLYRDVDGKLWAISGHSHCGHVGMFCGTSLDDLKHVYPIRQNFCVGHADYAFNGVRYPDGVKSRGSIWPFGLYICPKTHRFFAFFHNETGWSCRGTEYDAFGPCETPKYDSDFRHIGMMHSDDEGRTWTFDRWVVSGEQVCFTDQYNPEAGNKVVGQKSGIISLGSGDFSLYVDHEEGYLYLFYNMVRVDMDMGGWDGCDVYVARSRIRDDGVVPDFIKFYNGSFCEPGNFGKETPIARNSWHPRVVYSKPLKKFILTSVRVVPGRKGFRKLVDNIMQLQTGDSLTEFSAPIVLTKDGQEWGNHYMALVSDDITSPPNILTSNECSLLSNHNGTDVLRYKVKIAKK